MNYSAAILRGLAVLALASFAILEGCGVSPSPITVNVLPSTAVVPNGKSQQLTATVQNDPKNLGVTWTIDAPGCAGFNVCGKIDASGKYTASGQDFDQGLSITATSVADPTKKATVKIFVTPIGVAVSPTSATVQNGGAQQFVATGYPNGAPLGGAAVWRVSGSGCTGASCGTIDSTGRYIAPASPPTPPIVTITAADVADSSTAGTATVILGTNLDNAKLKGQYAFLVQGYDYEGYAIAGSFTADGNGNITAGVLDSNYSSLESVSTNKAFTGTYSIGSDNRGSMSISGGSGTSTYSFALDSFASGVAGRGRLVGLNDSRTSGVLAKQDTTAFSTAAITGGYAFGLTGTSSTDFSIQGGDPVSVSDTLVADGRFTASGGSLSAGQIDVHSLGVAFNSSGTPAANLPFAGTYAVDTNGRGTAVLTFAGQDPNLSNFSFYVISATELLFIELDNCPSVCTIKNEISGFALQQSGLPFSLGSLNGTSVFSLSTGSAAGSDAVVGLESFDGNGNLTGTSDANNGGVITSNMALAGTYTVDNNGLGRGAITLADDQQAKPIYLISPGKAFIIDKEQMGILEPQAGGFFSDVSVAGNYVMGTLSTPLNSLSNTTSGIVTSIGTGSLSGTSDGTGGSGQNFTGTYSVAPNGRATLAITPRVGSPSNMVFYLVSPSKAVGIQVDPGAANPAVNIIEKEVG